MRPIEPVSSLGSELGLLSRGRNEWHSPGEGGVWRAKRKGVTEVRNMREWKEWGVGRVFSLSDSLGEPEGLYSGWPSLNRSRLDPSAGVCPGNLGFT